MNTLSRKTAIIMAGGTGGHIFPGLAVAHALREKGWSVHWLGAPNSMENRIVPPHGYPFESVPFQGVRGKGLPAIAGLGAGNLSLLWAVAGMALGALVQGWRADR